MIKFGPIILLVLSLAGFSPEDHMLIYDEETYHVTSTVESDDLKGMIVPHHTVPMDIIVDMYKRSSSDVEHILLISPDHFLNERRHITTSRKSWSGSFGKVFNNLDLTNRFLSLPYVIENDEEIIVEHGINTHIPLITEYFPKADIVNLAISKEASIEELDEVIAMIPEDVFVIASVDFSHYLTKTEADNRDEQTIKYLENKDYERLFSLNDSYFDSPGCLYVIFKHLDETTDMIIYDHKNAFDYLGTFHNTTSYFTIGFK